MTKQMIEVDIPEGYEFVRYGIPVYGDYYLPCVDKPTLATGDQNSYFYNKIIIKKKQPERIIFEKSFEKRQVNCGERYLDDDGDIYLWYSAEPTSCKYYILTKVEE